MNNQTGLKNEKFKELIEPIKPTYWGVDFDIRNLNGEIKWIEDKMSKVSTNSKEYRDLKRQVSERVWVILLLELNKSTP